MIGHEAGDEIIAVVVARLNPQRQRDARRVARGAEQLGAELFVEERIGIADIDEQFARACAVRRRQPRGLYSN